MIIEFLLTILIVGFVTAAIGIRFDRFFTILLLLFLFKKDIHTAVDIFLWVILFGSLMIILENRKAIMKAEKKMKKKLFLIIPVLTFISTLIGSYLFKISSSKILLITLGVLAILYGLRLIFIHFKEDEFYYENHKPNYVKFCGLFGPIISGFFLGFMGTSLKPLKIPFAVKLGKMNIKQVYLGNTITSFFASIFALIWHHLFMNISSTIAFNNYLLAAGLWAGIHYIAEGTGFIFKPSWKKVFQIIVGITLTLVSIKIFMLV